MEPPAGARLEGGIWRYRPDLPHLSVLRLARSTYTTDYELCLDNGCQPLSRWIPLTDAVVTIEACGS